MSFRSAALSGMAWSLASQGVRMGFQFATTIILARLLAPEDFGIFAMVLPVAGIAGLLQDFGLNQAIIHREGLTQDQVSSMFWINFGITVSITLALVLLSPFIAAFYGEPRLTALVSAWSAILFLGGLSFGQYAQLARNLRFRTIALIDIAGACVAFSVGVGVSYVWPSYWALYLSTLFSVLSWTILTFATRTWCPSMPKRGVQLDGMFQFGMNLMVVSVADFASRNVDNILIGKMLGGHVLGLYDRAYKLLLYPLENLGAPLARVMIPILSRMQNDPVGFRRAFLQMAGVLGIVYIPGMAVAIGCSESLVLIFLGAKWLPIVPIFYWLGFVGLLQPLISTCGWLLIAQGRSRELMYVQVSSSVIIVTSFVIGIQWGAVGVAMAYATAEALFRAPLVCFVAGRSGAVSRKDMIETFAPLLLAGGVALLSVEAISATGVTGWRLIAVSLIAAYLEVAVVLSLTASGRALLGVCWKLVASARKSLNHSMATMRSGS